jgi:hypothetical protein
MDTPISMSIEFLLVFDSSGENHLMKVSEISAVSASKLTSALACHRHKCIVRH